MWLQHLFTHMSLMKHIGIIMNELRGSTVGVPHLNQNQQARLPNTNSDCIGPWNSLFWNVFVHTGPCRSRNFSSPKTIDWTICALFWHEDPFDHYSRMIFHIICISFYFFFHANSPLAALEISRIPTWTIHELLT